MMYPLESYSTHLLDTVYGSLSKVERKLEVILTMTSRVLSKKFSGEKSMSVQIFVKSVWSHSIRKFYNDSRLAKEAEGN